MFGMMGDIFGQAVVRPRHHRDRLPPALSSLTGRLLRRPRPGDPSLHLADAA